MLLNELLARSHVDARLAESQLSTHTIRAIAVRRAQRQAERSACLSALLTRSGLAPGPTID